MAMFKVISSTNEEPDPREHGTYSDILEADRVREWLVDRMGVEGIQGAAWIVEVTKPPQFTELFQTFFGAYPKPRFTLEQGLAAGRRILDLYYVTHTYPDGEVLGKAAQLSFIHDLESDDVEIIRNVLKRLNNGEAF